jgi:hypothetical protein
MAARVVLRECPFGWSNLLVSTTSENESLRAAHARAGAGVAHRSSGRPAWLNRRNVVALGLALLALVTLIDYMTGIESLFFIFYFLPVALFAWFLSRAAAEIMALASGIVWWSVDRLGGHVYPHELYRLWNALTCLAAFALLAWGVSEIRRRLEKEHRLNAALANTLEAQRRATDDIRKLQGQIQVVCAWTKRIRVADRWLRFEEFLHGQLGIEVTHGISEEAAQELRKQLEGPPPRG